jgi:hypothetical protein
MKGGHTAIDTKGVYNIRNDNHKNEFILIANSDGKQFKNKDTNDTNIYYYDNNKKEYFTLGKKTLLNSLGKNRENIYVTKLLKQPSTPDQIEQSTGGKRRTKRRRQRSNKKRTNKRKNMKTRMKKRKTHKRKTNKRRRKR